MTVNNRVSQVQMQVLWSEASPVQVSQVLMQILFRKTGRRIIVNGD